MLKNFLRKYGYYALAAVLVLAVGVSVGLTPSEPNGVVEDSQHTSTTAIEMLSPLDSAEVIKGYSDTELFYNSTLKQWESHKGLDLTSSTSDDVVSVLDGKVTDCSYSYENGYCITIEHADGLTTVYCSLEKNDNLKVGDTVMRGQKIGTISTTASNESAEGKHLHFQIKLNGKNVDPSNYLTLENK